MTRLQRGALVLILVSAAALRLTGLDWDGFQHHHPDERYITWVATTIEFPSIRATDWAATWRPETSTINPFRWPPQASSEGIVVLQNQPRDFAYGHVPLYLGVIATRLVERVAPSLIPLLPSGWSLTADVLNGAGRIEFHHLAAVGRALTALFDVGTVLFTFLLGRRLYGAAVGLTAAALLAFTVLHIQLAHFFTSDPYLTFFVVAAIYFMVAAQWPDDENAAPRSRRAFYLALAGVMVGLAVGSKFTAVLLLLPLLWTAWIVGRGAPRRWWPALLAVGLAVAIFALTNPFALLDWTCPPLESGGFLGRVGTALSRSCYAQNVMTQNAMVRGQIDLGFTRQYAGTLPYLYFFEMLLRWGMGPILGVVGLAGLGWAMWGIALSLNGGRAIRDHLAENTSVTPLMWVLPYLLLTGSFYVKFLRYMQPIVPFLLLFGAAMIWQWRGVAIRRAAVAVVLAGGALSALAFVAIYGAEHPWNAASRWIHQNAPPGSLILSEQLDDYLPVTMAVDGALRLRSEYQNAELAWLTLPDAADDTAKLDANLSLLAAADYLTVLSNRAYGVVPRLPQRFPISGQYHQLLFDGALGYELLWVGGRDPRLLGWSLRANTFGWPGLRPPAGVVAYWREQAGLTLGRADESFIVYDQPLTMIFRNTGRLSAAQLRAAFDLPGE